MSKHKSNVQVLCTLHRALRALSRARSEANSQSVVEVEAEAEDVAEDVAKAKEELRRHHQLLLSLQIGWKALKYAHNAYSKDPSALCTYRVLLVVQAVQEALTRM